MFFAKPLSTLWAINPISHIRHLARMTFQEMRQVPEEFDLEFNLFRGNTITLFQDGTFSIDGVVCDGPVYRGVEFC